MSETNETGMVVGRLSITDLMGVIRDSHKPELRYRMTTWLLILGEFIQDNRRTLSNSDYSLVISVPLVKKAKETKKQ